jgi:hypothetical protein
MNLLLLAGLVTPPTRAQLGQEGLAALVLYAEQALRGGFRPDAAFLSGCSDYEREALAQAGDRLAASTASLTGAAAQGLRQAAMATQDPKALAAVDDAEELARNRAAADRTLQGALGESSLTRVPTRVVSIEQLQAGDVGGPPAEIAR